MQLSTDKMIGKKEGHIGWMTFNNPDRRNAMSLEMWEAAGEIMANFKADPDIRVVVMQGAGDKAFVSGADISQFEKMRADAAMTELYNQRADAGRSAIRDFDRPIIAMIRGFCMGGGLGIAMSADLRFAAEGSTFGIPAARLSIAYTGENIVNLYNLVGPSRAKDILYSARRFDEQEALSIGLINRVFSPEALEDETRAYCETLANNAPLSIKAHKVILGELSKKQPDMSKNDEVAKMCFDSADYKEGRTAFMEKRPPVWKGA
jgi:enoyl-CoA hydratase/carnithine racemase